jgi:hypothetical protein
MHFREGIDKILNWLEVNKLNFLNIKIINFFIKALLGELSYKPTLIGNM